MGRRRDEDSSSEEDDESSDSSSSSTFNSDGSSTNSSSDSSSLGSSSGSERDESASDMDGNENFEIGFWQSLKSVMPWTDEGREADYAEERLDAHEEFQEELDQALLIRKMVETGMHDRALERLMASTEGQMYHHFHKHRYILEQSGEWSFVPPSVRRKWRLAPKKTDKVEKLRSYMAMRRDRFLRIRALCGQVRSARINRREPVVTIMPKDLIDKNLLALEGIGGEKKPKPAGVFGLGRVKKCHWQDISSKGEACTCTNYRMEHPHRLFRDEFGVMVHDTLATCGWHASHCVSIAHGDDPVMISTANEGALCNECLAQIVKGPIRATTAFGAPGVRFQNKKRIGTADADGGAGGDEFLAWNKWFTKGPGRFRKSALRPRHPHAPPGSPPSGLRPPAVFVPPPPPPPLFSKANFRRQQRLAKWRLNKEKRGGWAATAVQKTYRGYRARYERATATLEHPERAKQRVESAIVMQSIVRRFLARALVLQIAAFRDVHATAIQRIVRGFFARVLFHQKRAKAIVRRQMLFLIARMFMGSARIAKKIREEMRKKNAVALSLQRAWRGKKGREKAAMLRSTIMRRVGAAITAQKAWRCYVSRRHLRGLRASYKEAVQAATVVQSVFRMAMDKRQAKRKRQYFVSAARTLQPMARGMLGRLRARRERAMVNQVWRWLGTDTETANNKYSRFLPKTGYEVYARRGSRGSVSVGAETKNTGTSRTEVTPSSSLTASGLKVFPGDEHFSAHFDKDRTGTCSKVEFKLGLESFCREVGYPLQKAESLMIFRRYYDGDGFCGWHSFLTTYHAQLGGSDACSRHGRLLCALCVRHGRCEKPGCACAKARAARSGKLGFKVCECGHQFEAHRLLAGGTASIRSHRGGRVLPEKKLNDLLSASAPSFPIDRPINVEGCTTSTPSHVTHVTSTGDVKRTSPDTRKKLRRRNPCHTKDKSGQRSPELSLISGLEYHSLPRPVLGSGPKHGKRPENAAGAPAGSYSLPPGNTVGFPSPVQPADSMLLQKRKRLPTLRQAKEQEQESRDMSWAGRRGQAKRAALTEMNSSAQGRNAAEYAVRLHDDIASNAVALGDRSNLAPVQSKDELRRGFAISDAVPFVRAGVLKATTDPVGLYLYLIKALSDDRSQLLEDNIRFTDFVTRHAVFLERHWCKIVKDIRNGRLDPHLPITEEKRARTEAFMLPQKKRAQKLDDLLRVLGFHARASGAFETKPSVSSSPNPKTSRDSEGGMSRALSTRNARNNGVVRGELTPEERQESLAKKVEASRKRRPGTAGEASEEMKSRRQRRTVTGGELECHVRLVKSRLESRSRSPSAGAVPVMPTADQATQEAYELLTTPSAKAAGVLRAPSGRRVRKHLCLHPGCGKAFHLKETAKAHQEKEHRFRQRLATPTPLADQFLSTAWPSDGVPWSRRSPSPALDPRGKSPAKGHAETALTRDESSLVERFACGVPGCEHCFPAVRLLGLHMRMGHTDFDREKIKAVTDGTRPTVTVDGLSITSSIEVGGRVSARFIGTYRLVPPFSPPSGCHPVLACPHHSRIKESCRTCEDIVQAAAPAGVDESWEFEAGEGSTLKGQGVRSPLGLPLPPAKFYRRARVQINHHGRPTTLDLDCDEALRCTLLSFPRGPHHCTPSVSTAQPSSAEGTKDGRDLDPSIRPSTCETLQDETSEMFRHSCVKSGGLGMHATVGSLSGVGSTLGEKDPERDGKEANNRNQNREGCKSVNANASSTCEGGKNMMNTTPGQVYSRADIADPSHLTNGADRGSSSPGQHRAHSSQHPLVPARLIAVLVDGAGRGWMAARRLWSVREVGVHALAEAGLAFADVDQEQEFFAATEVEYLPLSLVRDTCAVKISSRDDVHSKQKLGDLPKRLMYVTHGVDSTTGSVLLKSELNMREQQLLRQ